MIRFVTHPQVRIDPATPVPQWGLNDVGRARATAMLRQPWVANVDRILSSDETKALDTAAIVAGAIGVPIDVRVGLRENDRSSTGFLPGDEFESVADAFFAHPDRSVRGWETAADAQRRVVAATADVLEAYGDVLVVGHGATGTLLLCHLLGVPISRGEDQTGGEAAPGGGNVWCYDPTTGVVRHRWRPIELLE